MESVTDGNKKLFQLSKDKEQVLASKARKSMVELFFFCGMFNLGSYSIFHPDWRMNSMGMISATRSEAASDKSICMKLLKDFFFRGLEEFL